MEKCHFEFEHRGLTPLMQTFDQISNRLVFGIVLASLVIGSSIIIHSKIAPLCNGIPLIVLVGFCSAGLMGFWLLISIIRHGKM
jgi:ubiquinone biosynthesis protein